MMAVDPAVAVAGLAPRRVALPNVDVVDDELAALDDAADDAVVLVQTPP